MVSRSGLIDSPCSSVSSPTFTTAVIWSPGRTCTRPLRNRAAPTPPAMTVITRAPYRRPSSRSSARFAACAVPKSRKAQSVVRSRPLEPVGDGDDALAQPVDVEADGLEGVGGDPVADRDAQQQVLAAHVVVAEGQRLAGGQVEDPAGLRRERDAAARGAVRAAPAGTTAASAPCAAGAGWGLGLGREQPGGDRVTDLLGGDAHLLDRGQREVPGHVEEAEQQVLGADEGVVGGAGGVDGGPHGGPGPLGEAAALEAPPALGPG